MPRNTISTRRRLLSLPWEIVLMVADYLTPQARILLALTCKPLFSRLFSTDKAQALKRGDLSSLLQLLEKDCPRQFLCFGCLHLCAFDPEHKHGWRGQNHEHCSNHPSRDHSIMSLFSRISPTGLLMGSLSASSDQASEGSSPFSEPRLKDQAIAFPHARLVMNQHLYGELHGLPLSTLDYDYDFEFEDLIDMYDPAIGSHRLRRNRLRGRQSTTSGATLEGKGAWRRRQTSTAKIIDEELYISHFYHMTGPSAELECLRELLSKAHIPICHHMSCHKNQKVLSPKSQGWIDKPYPVPLVDLYDEYDGHAESTGCCPHCFTDYQLTVQGGLGTDSWTVEMTTYHRLGSCRTPGESFWQRNTSDSYDTSASIQRLDDRAKNHAGEIRRQWHESDGEADNPQDSPAFVEDPWPEGPIRDWQMFYFLRRRATREKSDSLGILDQDRYLGLS